MVQQVSRALAGAGASAPAPSVVLFSRAARCGRSTAVRCFKSNSDDAAPKATATALKLNFKLGFRVNFGQSVALLGSGEPLGNWDPKRSVKMTWTDGDFWTAELSVTPGTPALDMEYKYLVLNSDGTVNYWKPGGNYKVSVPLLPNASSKVPKRVKISDAWDDSYKKVDIEETDAGGSKPAPKPAQAPAAAAPPPPPPPPAASAPGQAAAKANAASNGSATASVPPPPPPPPAAAAASSAAPSAGPSAAAPPPPSPQPQAQSASSSAQVPHVEPQKVPRTTTPPRSTSPRSGTQLNFATATSIPRLHPSMMAEQERLEDGVKTSLEDLQTQMDKHQQLREKSNEAKAEAAAAAVAAANTRTEALAEVVAALAKEVANLREQLAATQDLLRTTTNLLHEALSRPSSLGVGPAPQQVFVSAVGPGGWWPVGASTGGQPAAAAAAPTQPLASAAAPTVVNAEVTELALAAEGGAVAAPAPAAATQDGQGLAGAPPPAAPGPRGKPLKALQTLVARRAPVTVSARGFGRKPSTAAAGQRSGVPMPQPTAAAAEAAAGTQAAALPVEPAPEPTAAAADVPPSAQPAAAEPSPAPSPVEAAPRAQPAAAAAPTARPKVVRVRSAAARTPSPNRAHPAPTAAAMAAVMLPVVCGVGRGGKAGARGNFNMQLFRQAGRGREVPRCVQLTAVKSEGEWQVLSEPRDVTPADFMKEAGLKGKAWRSSIRVLVGDKAAQPLEDVLSQAVTRVAP